MKFSTIGYTFKEGIRNVWINKIFSIASIATMAACIFLFGIFYSILVNFQSVMNDVQSDVAITVFFDEGTTQERIDQIGMEITSRSEVSHFNFISADQAWEEYKEIYFEGNEELATAFGSENPLANEASYEIYMEDLSQQQVLAEYMESLDAVREVHQSETVANTLSDANKLIGVISVAIIVILICVAVFLISNTVRTGITVRKEEIGIMKMIGATDYFVRVPFVVEGVLIGAVGAIIPLAILYVGYGRVISYVADRFGFLSNMINFVSARSVFTILLPVGLILGIGIGYIGSRVTVHRHIQV
ncbi:MAG: permease-like cell division protein FtsX [Clostridiales bacterium]|nr:permease-like cell division protein FtsX [Clostridiales bacterium]